MNPYRIVVNDRETWVRIERARRKRHLSILVDAEGVRVRVPWHTSAVDIERAIHHHLPWIERQCQRWSQCLVQPQSFDDAPAQAWASLSDERDRQHQALLYLTEQTHEVASALGLLVQDVKWSRARRVWGSANSRGVIRYHARLAELPRHLVRYVVVHEVCHLRHMNHSAEFWGLVATLDPLWRQHRKALRQIWLSASPSSNADAEPISSVHTRSEDVEIAARSV